MKKTSKNQLVKILILSLVLASFVIEIKPTHAATITMGETSILSDDDSGNANLLIAQSATLNQSGTLQSLSFYVPIAAGKLRLGVYDASGPSGGPGNKLAETAELTPVTGWNTANVISGVSLSPGNYWLAYLSNSNSLHFYKGAGASYSEYSFTYGTMPSVFSTSAGITDGIHWSFYATVVTSGVADTTPPTISISSPAINAILSGTATIQASASDNIGLAGVQFKLDGSNLGTEDTISPYSIAWDTTTASNSSHTITAVARDTSNNTTTSSAITVTVSNSSAPPGGGGGGVVNASSCSLSAVQSAINSAPSGSTVSVPAGNCSWNGSLLLSSKDIAVVGAGSSSTKITGNGGNCFTLSMAYNTRVSGFGFTNCGYSSTGLPAAGKAFRIDHNSFTSNSWIDTDFTGDAQTPMRHPTGLIDNNSFYNLRVAALRGSSALISEGNYQSQLWAQDPPKGQGNGIVYIEHNVIDSNPNIHQNYVDGNYGGRYVSRFNTISGNTYAEIHSVQGANRAVQWWEIYKNTDTKPAESWYPFVFARGGSGFIWGNRVSSNYTNDILLDNVRSQNDPGDGVGACAGSSSWDQNMSGMFGYACRDQIGRSKDDTIWSPGGAYAQALTPAYFWDNLKGSSSMNININDACGYSPCLNRNSLHIVQNRDWYTQNNSFNGSSGVGQGPLSARPSTCTTGVAYWATDTGEWDSTHSGADGQLYKCTSTNIWSAYYTPFQYPYPVTAAGFADPNGSGSPTPTNNLPAGTFDGLKTDGITLQGWSYDPDSSSSPLNIQIFVDGPAGTGTLVSTQSTNILRTDVNSSFGISGNHGFEFAIPTQYRDGNSHSYYVYGIDINDSSKSTLLSGSPKSFTIAPSATPIKGDINLDHIVNSIDFSILNSDWFTSNARSDLNTDGLVNAIDYSLLNANWFKTW